MGWSLGVIEPDNPALIDAALFSAGKALYLSNLFEVKCKFVLRFVNLGNYFENHPNSIFTDAIVSISKDKLLGPTLEDLSKFPMVTPEKIEILDKARLARNFIAHEGAAFGRIFYIKDEKVFEHLKILKTNVNDLIAGDNIVSGWTYEIEEKEPAIKSMIENYPEMAIEWVFSHLEDF